MSLEDKSADDLRAQGVYDQDMNYEEALQYLESLSRFGMQLGLSRMEQLLVRLDNPEQKLPFVHLAGTNGKGSTSSMLARCLQSAGLRTGLFISPFVICFRERMQIDGQMIPEEDFARLATRLRPLAEELEQSGNSPTQFEFETALAFCWYQERGCDIVCLEVGLGGRFDSTNIIPPPLLQVICSIGLDHTAILGDTLEAIAYEKAGIIKGGTVVCYAKQSPKTLKVLVEVCTEKGARLITPNLNELEILDRDWLTGSFSYEGKVYHKSLPGTVQVYNCLTVIEAARALQARGLPLREEDIRAGLEQTSLPARMECLSHRPLVILDGAHNPDGAQALAAALRQLQPRRSHLIIGVLEDKNHAEILGILAPYVEQLYALRPDSPRALSAEALAEEACALGISAKAYDTEEVAIEAALAALPEEGLLLACGSLYQAASLRPRLQARLAAGEGDTYGRT